MTNLVVEKQYILNCETGKIELHFTKAEYQALSDQQKTELMSAFLFSGQRRAWASRLKNNHLLMNYSLVLITGEWDEI